VFFVAIPRLRLLLVVMGAISLGIVGLLSRLPLVIGNPGGGMSWYPGFAIHEEGFRALPGFLWQQFGLHCLLIPAGMLLAPRRARVFALPAFLAAAVAFTLQFSPDILANHKFINFALIMGQMLSACALVRGYDALAGRATGLAGFVRRGVALSGAAAVLLFATLSGVIDALAISNDPIYLVPDVASDPVARWFYKNTPRNAVVLNSTFFHHPATLAGRKIFIGWPYFTIATGYAHEQRMEIVRKIYAGGDPGVFCPLLRSNNIGYLTAEDNSNDPSLVPVNHRYFRANFKPSFVSADGRYAIYSTDELCRR